MKILLIHQMFLEEDDPGGSRYNEMTKIWTENKHEITVLSGMMHYIGNEKRPEYKNKWFVNKKQGSVDVWRCHVSEAYNVNFLGRLWGYFSFMFSSIWAGIFKVKGKYDIILVTSPPLFVGITALVLSKLKRIPYVFEVRDLWPESAIDTGVLKSKPIIKLAFWVEKLIYRNAKKINVLTPAFRKHLIEQKNISPDKVFYIPNASDFTLTEDLLKNFDTAALRKKYGWEDRFIITYVGAHGVANGLDQVLDAAELLADTNVLFLLIGEGMLKQDLMKQVESRGIKNIAFLPAVPKSEVFKYILMSDMGASILKKVDAFKTVYSNKTFDYMACKKPILMAIDGVSRELVEEANAGMYIEPENPSEYNRIIRIYLADSKMLQDQGEAGYQYARANFDRKILAEKYLKELQNVILNGN